MHFEYPGLMWLLVIPVLLVLHYIWMEYAQRHPHLRVSTSVPWKRSGSSYMSYLRHVPFIFRLVAIVLIIIALARPQDRNENVTAETEGIDVVLAMDISTSMLAQDFFPDRFTASKEIAGEFISQRHSDRIGIVVFAGEGLTQCPLTTNKSILASRMNEIQMGLIDDGTDMGIGLGTAVARLSESTAPSKVVILLTDGVHNLGDISPEKAIELATDLGVRVYTIGVGTNGYAISPVMTPWGIRYENVKVEIDEALLQKMAQSTGGKYFRATDNTKLAEIYSEINHMETGKTTVENVISYEELFFKYVLWAMVALMLELLFNWFVIRRLP